MNPASESPVYSFLLNPTMVDFDGHLSVVVFTSGCNFKCGFCHNALLMRDKQTGITWERLGEACRRFKNDWVDGAVISGGEPTLAPDLLDLIGFLKDFGLSVKLDTNGSKPDVLKECLPGIDYVAMDIKTGLSGYPEMTGCVMTDAIEESIALIRDKAADYEFRTTVIEAFHDDERMKEIGNMINGAKKYVVQPFVPREGLPDPVFEKMPRTSPDRLKQIAELMKDYVEEVFVRGEM